MIPRAVLDARLATLREQREAQGRQLFDLQQALRATERTCAQLDGALLVLQELLAVDAEPALAAAGPGARNGAPEEEDPDVHDT